MDIIHNPNKYSPNEHKYVARFILGLLCWYCVAQHWQAAKYHVFWVWGGKLRMALKRQWHQPTVGATLLMFKIATVRVFIRRDRVPFFYTTRLW